MFSSFDAAFNDAFDDDIPFDDSSSETNEYTSATNEYTNAVTDVQSKEESECYIFTASSIRPKPGDDTVGANCSRTTDDDGKSGPAIPKVIIRDDVSALTCDVDSMVGPKTATTLTSHSRGTKSMISASNSGVAQLSRLVATPGEKYPGQALGPYEKPKRPVRCLIIFVVALLLVTGIGGAVIGTRLRGSISTSNGPTADEDAAPTPNPNFEADDELLALLKSVSLDDGAALYNISTPQHRAYVWLWEDDKVARTWPNHTRIQRYALATLYFATGGNRWQHNKGWLSGTSHCEWYINGNNIFCSSDSVKLISLSDNNLEGTLPAELALLSSSLEFVNISDSILGPIPTELGLLTRLEAISLQNNSLTSTIPTELGVLTALTLLDVTRNPTLAGRVPTELGKLEALRVFRAGHTKLRGGVPTTFGNLTLLEELVIDNTVKRGETQLAYNNIPTEIGLMTNLKTIRLDTSGIDGRIPSEIGTLSSLHTLVLYGNNITGRIPPHVGRLVSLKTLRLDTNHLVGPIPTSFKRLKNLEEAALGFNELESFDDSLFTLPNLQKLLLFRNNLKGTIPTLIGRMSRLTDFDVSWNFFNSTIPSEVANANQLRLFATEGNSMTGTIPRGIYKLVELKFLGLGPNNFVGNALDPSIGRLTNLDKLSVSSYLTTDYRLRGTLPTELGLLTNLNDVTIAITEVAGTIPTELGNLLKMKWLHIVYSDLTGPIPSELGRLQKLKELQLAESPFSGTIPSELGRIRFLDELSVTGTNLTGRVPTALCELGGLNLLEVEHQVLCSCCAKINGVDDDDDV